MNIEVKKLKLMFLYRHLYFKNIHFFTNNKEYINIVAALNIKSKKKRLAYVYEELIKYINKYYVDDLCQFEGNQCIVQRQTRSKTVNGCCTRCHLVTDKGCPSSNVACKLIYCKTALGNVKLLHLNDIPIVRCLSISQRLVLMSGFFKTREEVLKNMNCGLIYTLLKDIVKAFCFGK